MFHFWFKYEIFLCVVFSDQDNPNEDIFGDFVKKHSLYDEALKHCQNIPEKYRVYFVSIKFIDIFIKIYEFSVENMRIVWSIFIRPEKVHRGGDFLWNGRFNR